MLFLQRIDKIVISSCIQKLSFVKILQLTLNSYNKLFHSIVHKFLMQIQQSKTAHLKLETMSSKKKRFTKIGPYILLKQIGKGSYSIVYQSYKQDDPSKQKYAVKKISLQNVNKKQLQRIHLELNVLSVIKHKNIVQLIDSKQTSTNLYLVFQMCKYTDLQSHITKCCNGKLPQDQVKKIMIQIKNAFMTLRQYKIVHRDLKLSNILVTDDFMIKIADFGFAKSLSENQFLKSCVGTLLTMAPEILEKKQYNEKCDIWSLGIIIYQMLFGVNPFFKNMKMTKKQIKNSLKGQITFPFKISDSAKDLIEKMLSRDCTKRCSFEQFFSHPWFKDQSQWQDNLDKILLEQALNAQLKKNVSKISKTEQEKKIIINKSDDILNYTLIQFIKNMVQNQLMLWVNLGKKIIDMNYENSRLSFLAICSIIDNIDYILKQEIQLVLNSKKKINIPTYMQLRDIQTWEMSLFSRRLPNFLQKSKFNFEQYIKKSKQQFGINFESQQRLIQVYLLQLMKQVSLVNKKCNPNAYKQELRPFLKISPTQLGKIQIKIQSIELGQKALNLLLKRLNSNLLVSQKQSIMKKVSPIFKCTQVKRRSEMDKLYELMKLKCS